MKALQVVSRGVAEFISTPTPEIKSGFALVKPKYITLCGSDIWMLHHCPDEMYPFDPGTTGHEVIAEVEKIENKLFQTRVFFPANTIPGTYDINIYQIHNKIIMGRTRPDAHQ